MVWKTKRIAPRRIGIKILLFCCMFVMGCAKAVTKDRDGTLQIVIYEESHSLFHAPFYIAIQEGYFTEEGISIILTDQRKDVQKGEKFSDDRIEMALLGSDHVFEKNEKGERKYDVVAKLTSCGEGYLISPKRIEKCDWKKMNGKSITIAPTDGVSLVLLPYIFEKKGIEIGELGQGEYFVVTDENALEARRNGGSILTALGDHSKGVAGSCFFVEKGRLTEEKSNLLCFARALQKGITYVETHEAKEIAKRISSYFEELPVEEREEVISQYKKQDAWKEAPCFSSIDYSILQNVLLDAKMLQESVAFEQWFCEKTNVQTKKN